MNPTPARHRFRAVIACLAAVVLATSACSSVDSGGKGGADVKGPRWGGTLVVGLPYDVTSFNDNYDADSVFPYVAPNIYSRLVNYTYSNGELYGDLASKWHQSKDGRTYTFDLRRGVTWSDGKPFTAADVVFTYQSILAKGEKATTYPLYSDIAKVSAEGDHRVVFRLKEPNASFLTRIADYYGAWILPKHIYGKGDPTRNPANAKPVGTGPFVFSERSPGDHLTLKRNPHYFGQKAYVDKLVFRVIADRSTATSALRSGEIQYATTSPAFSAVTALEKDSRLAVDKSDSQIFQSMEFNTRRGPLQKTAVRRAVAQAIDTEQLNKVVYKGLARPGKTMFLSYSWAVDKKATQPAFDPAAARKALDAAGYPAKKGGTRFSLTYTTWNTSIFGGPELAKVVKEQLAEVGVDVKIEQNDFSLYNERVRVKHDFDLNAAGGLYGPDPDAYTQYYLSTSSRNDGQYKNPKVDAMFTKARTSTDRADRKAEYAKIQRVLAADLPRMNLVEYVTLRPYNTGAHDFWWQPSATGKSVGQDQYNRVWLSTGKTEPPAGD